MSLTVSGTLTSTVALVAGALPAGVTAAFSPAFLTSAEPAGTLTLAATSRAVAGSYNLTITASGGGIIRTLAIPFWIAAPCVYSLDALQISSAAGAAAYKSQVTTSPACPWTAVSQSAWLSIASGGSGAGNGTVNFSLTVNPLTTVRSGTLLIAGKTLAVLQASAPPSFSVNPASARVTAAAARGSFTVSSSGSANWLAKSAAGWIKLSSAAAAPGSHPVVYTVLANQSSLARSGTIALSSNLVFTINQAGVACLFSLNLGSPATVKGVTNDSAKVLASAPDCGWTANSNVSWIKVQGGMSGAGSGVVKFSVAQNPAGTARSGVLTVAGRAISITERNSTQVTISAPK